ncbi:MAG TPA: Hsp70 family protein, partial [Gemmatales bacterium]|nr:Hsp70 family protein [Gemmatales bacterium]
AQLLLGAKSEVLLLDVTPLSFGIETLGGVMTRMIERNTTIAAQKKNTFSTADDNQPSVTVKVFQGEREMANDNKLLGIFNLDGIPPAPRGVPQIEVAFDIDHNGILNVSAKDLGTGKEQKIRIEASSGLSAADIDKMRKDAELHAGEDKKKRELAETRNQAEQMAYQTEKLIKDMGDKLAENDKAPLTSAIERVRTAAKGEDVAAMKAAMESLQQASHAMSQQMYKAAQPGAGAEPAGAGPGAADKGKDDVIDAEYEVKK